MIFKREVGESEKKNSYHNTIEQILQLYKKNSTYIKKRFIIDFKRRCR